MGLRKGQVLGLESDVYYDVELLVAAIIEYYETHLHSESFENHAVKGRITRLVNLAKKDLKSRLISENYSNDEVENFTQLLTDRVLEEIDAIENRFRNDYISPEDFYLERMQNILQ